MTAALHLLRPLPARRRLVPVDDSREALARRQAEADAARAWVAHRALSDRARRLMPNCTPGEAAELQRLIDAGPRQGLRHAVLHLELAGVRPVAESSLCA